MAFSAREGEVQAVVRLDFEYPVRFTRDALAPGNPDLLESLRRRERFGWHRVLFIVDAAAAGRCGPQAPAYVSAYKGSLALAAPVLIASEGALKRPAEAAGWLRARMAAAELGERGHVVAIGGEALQEAAGFAAATLRPAPRLTRMGTAPLGQIRWSGRCESGAEGPGLQARCAAFVVPFAVINDALWLGQAAPEDRGAALIEAARLALSQDAALFHWMCDKAAGLGRGDAEPLACVVRWAARLALATPSSFGAWSLGVLPPVAALALDCLLSRACGLPAEAADAALRLLREWGIKVWVSEWGRTSRLAAALAEAVPPEGLSLLSDIGRIQAGIPADEAALEAAAGELRRSLGKKGGVGK